MKHWHDNLAMAKSINWRVQKYDLAWQSCSYCVNYFRNMCVGCPLIKYRCPEMGSPYNKVHNLLAVTWHVKYNTTQKQLIEAISYMIKCLEEVNDD